ncbi:aromatic acid exporter family protein [Arthrobacter sp. lap29]|uniref:FUSC family protein n=1 Tax=Arthrobacter sp. lap29 TaxID=3056122 RepID=UPI0028F74104|nr:aromatic acid exporter family protein [Arthrobacter sp. lap29]
MVKQTWKRFLVWAKSSLAGQRLLLAAKTSLAVGVAWILARYMPGVADKYPYYAPLGALVSMYPTLMGSVRAGLQTLAGLFIGILLAAGVLLAGTPNILSISLAVGLGVLVAGDPRLGVGKDYVPVAVLFVLIVGGQDADSYSVGYALQMALGVTVGLVVNLLIFPPLAIDAARLLVSRGRNLLVGQLEDIARALVESWPPEREDWSQRSGLINTTVSEIRGAAYHADESRKGNPRAYLHSRHQLVTESFEDLNTLESVAFNVRDITEVLSTVIWGNDSNNRLHPNTCKPMSECLQSVGSLMSSWDEGTAEQLHFDQAREALNLLDSELKLSARQEDLSLTPGAAVAFDCERILNCLHQRIIKDRAEEPV